jgi:spermidine/putrescine transport system substrate-binding protein
MKLPEKDFVDPALVRGMTQKRVSRRDVLRGGIAGAGALGLSALLAACGVSGTAEQAKANKARDWGKFWARQKKTGQLNFANWPYYIDTKHGKHPTLEMFEKATGIKVNYQPVIQNNAPFYAKIAPSLKAKETIGYDIIVITNGWQLTELIDNGWLIPLDHSQLPNFAKYASPAVKDPSYDPGNKYTVAWQSGLTGIAYDPTKTGRKITSLADLWDPKFKGKVGMMSDNTELGSAGLLKLGVDPATSTPDDWHKAAQELTKQRDSGIVRQYYDQSYIKALEDGDTWITQAWSGDVFQAQNSGYPHLEFVVPEEGVMHWTDNCMIPMGAEHPADALMWMNYYYQPKIEALIEDWVWYICPVPDAKQIIANKLDDPTVANSPLVFPTKAMEAKFSEYYTFKNFSQNNQWNSIFDPIIQS